MIDARCVKGFYYKHLTTTSTFLNSVAMAVWWYLFLYRGGQTQKNDRSCIFDSKCNQGDQISHSQRNHVLRAHHCIISQYTQIYSHVITINRHIKLERYWPLLKFIIQMNVFDQVYHEKILIPNNYFNIKHIIHVNELQ